MPASIATPNTKKGWDIFPHAFAFFFPPYHVNMWTEIRKQNGLLGKLPISANDLKNIYLHMAVIGWV